MRARVLEYGAITLDQLARELKEQFDVEVHRWSICRVLHKMNLSHKKRTLYAAEQHRSDVSSARHLWVTKRLPFMGRALERLVFIDETSTNTKLTKRTGWAPVGERLVDHVPFRPLENPRPS